MVLAKKVKTNVKKMKTKKGKYSIQDRKNVITRWTTIYTGSGIANHDPIELSTIFKWMSYLGMIKSVSNMAEIKKNVNEEKKIWKSLGVSSGEL